MVSRHTDTDTDTDRHRQTHTTDTDRHRDTDAWMPCSHGDAGRLGGDLLDGVLDALRVSRLGRLV